MLTHEEFKARSTFDQQELLAFAYGRLIKDPPEGFRARLPVPPMLMVDRISEISGSGAKGRISAARDVRLDDWFFHCHFLGDPVQPGCLATGGAASAPDARSAAGRSSSSVRSGPTTA